MDKNSLPKKINHMILKAAHYIEILMSCIITVVIFIMIIELMLDLPQSLDSAIHNDGFNDFLSSALGLVVGIEFVKMLCNYTPETIIEVLMLATARQMVVEHLRPFETLIGTLAIAVLFAVRRFLFTPNQKKEKEPS